MVILNKLEIRIKNTESKLFWKTISTLFPEKMFLKA